MSPPKIYELSGKLKCLYIYMLPFPPPPSPPPKGKGKNRTLWPLLKCSIFETSMRKKIINARNKYNSIWWWLSSNSKPLGGFIDQVTRLMITRPINVYITKTKQFKWKFKQQNEKNWSDFWLSMIRNDLQNSKSTLIPNYNSKDVGLSLIL